MSSQSQLTVCNLALLSVGSRNQISALNEGSVPANTCSTYFTFVFEQLARTAKWGCLNKQTTLTLIQAAQGTPENPTGSSLPLPQQPWLYGYLYPSDCLLMRSVAPPVTTSGSVINQTSLANSVTPLILDNYAIPYSTGYSVDANNNPLEVILTNQESAVANYNVNQQNPQSWDSLFTSAYVASLAAYLVPALNLNPPLMQQSIATAERMIGLARGMDANENVLTQDHTPDWIRARSGTTGSTNRYGFAGYGVMQWPVC